MLYTHWYMKKILIATLLAIISTGLCHAQSDAVQPKKERKCDHIFGVQINELTRQILAVNNSSTVANNPYLVTYNLTNRATGIGFRSGLGFKYSSQSYDMTKAKSQALNIRVGIEKAFKLSDKWGAGVGVDVVYKAEDSSFGGASIYGYDISYKSNKTGGGPTGWLRFSVSKKILVGTEMSMYYLAGNENYGSAGFAGGNSNAKVTDFKFNLPVIFFLFLKL